MADVEVKVPAMGESISEGTISRWFKKEGEAIKADEALFEIETDKVTQEIYAPVSGVVKKLQKAQGANAAVGETVAVIDSSASAAAAPAEKPAAPAAATAPKQQPMAETLPPAAKKLATEKGVDTSAIAGSGKHGQVTKGDVLEAAAQKQAAPAPAQPARVVTVAPGERETVQPMSRLRRAIAERLVSAQQTAAILTTFNEVDMKPAMDLRAKHNEDFQKKYGVKIGFMSLFTKAVVSALKEVPAINAEIRGNDIVYKNYYDIGVAVGGPRGLVVPIVRGADQLNFSEIEIEISRLAARVKEGSITLPEMEGGTFTISNGGIYGSMMSTPILNPPQSGILGMHNIVKRAVVVSEGNTDKIEIRPMMYIALSYDHRIVDGKEAVTFLVKVKQAIEDPVRLLLGV
ncbi:2-oxoglutarate dehydrogenase complex dihydrolipoyllysine-residue succinyltransferase [Turneriella parva]|uniref:Dihydrolipoyllysine-residue succinyltransferase component of 2-oxoglutarate dehydrogenase complex n=1 Tax=Turneriella parva (strain ATCC BAA-1111 / DSM 21527 / NCTC 11395 / H) TaxID=869212 RepID=I4B971_TURPD|nr:2-oxoglutarate dehydrogenase complex dihydrolipoyllysine-residue succinyltransferase [Turneriella parva]AFM13828.1 2-oxoglutarate dehydrogenase E2 component [Turneriella parva DSM 21527]